MTQWRKLRIHLYRKKFQIGKIQGKLEPKYNGIYTIERKTRCGNYILKNQAGESLKQSYVPSRLKLIPDDINKERLFEFLEIKRIIKHKKKGNNNGILM